jgi:hypothetical protein
MPADKLKMPSGPAPKDGIYERSNGTVDTL